VSTTPVSIRCCAPPLSRRCSRQESARM
jgi:hypothetical protein